MSIGTITLVKIFIPAALTFLAGVFMAPLLTHYFYKYKMWKRNSRGTDDKSLAFKKIHNETGELSTPRIGGVIIWLSVAVVTLVLALLSAFSASPLVDKLNFLSRGQTFIPLFALFAAALVGLADDLLQIYGKGGYANDDVIYRRVKAGAIIFIGLIIGWWFVAKLGMTAVHIPFYGSVEFGYLFIPFLLWLCLQHFQQVSLMALTDSPREFSPLFLSAMPQLLFLIIKLILLRLPLLYRAHFWHFCGSMSLRLVFICARGAGSHSRGLKRSSRL